MARLERIRGFRDWLVEFNLSPQFLGTSENRRSVLRARINLDFAAANEIPSSWAICRVEYSFDFYNSMISRKIYGKR